MKGLIALALLLTAPVAVTGQSAGAPRPWEHFVWEDRSFKVSKQQTQLDSLGRAGWELTGTIAVQVQGTTGAMFFYFKRPGAAEGKNP